MSLLRHNGTPMMAHLQLPEHSISHMRHTRSSCAGYAMMSCVLKSGLLSSSLATNHVPNLRDSHARGQPLPVSKQRSSHPESPPPLESQLWKPPVEKGLARTADGAKTHLEYTRSPLEDSRLFGPSPWKILSHYLRTNGCLSKPAPGENLLSGNFVRETGCSRGSGPMQPRGAQR